VFDCALIRATTSFRSSDPTFEDCGNEPSFREAGFVAQFLELRDLCLRDIAQASERTSSERVEIHRSNNGTRLGCAVAEFVRALPCFREDRTCASELSDLVKSGPEVDQMLAATLV
jgi:hypothetical protein